MIMNAFTTIVTIVVSAVLLITLVYPMVNDPDDASNTLDVIIIEGQSNAEYNTHRCNPYQVDLPVPTQRLMYYGNESEANSYPGTSSTGVYEMNRDGSWKIGGLEPALAYYYSLHTNNPVLTINVARGGMSISWLSAEAEGLGYAKEVIDAALSNIHGYHVRMAGWVMAQGEADKNMDVDVYKEYFLELRDYYKSIGADECYLIKTRDFYGGNSVIAQEELCEEYEDIHMATTITDTFTDDSGYVYPQDPIHYTQVGRNVVGESVADYMSDFIPNYNSYELLKVVPIIIAVAIILGAVGLMVASRLELF